MGIGELLEKTPGKPGPLLNKGKHPMGISVSILLIAAGAILKWAVTASTSGTNLQTVGMILFVVGIVGLVASMMFWSSWGGSGNRRSTIHE